MEGRGLGVVKRTARESIRWRFADLRGCGMNNASQRIDRMISGQQSDDLGVVVDQKGGGKISDFTKLTEESTLTDEDFDGRVLLA